MLSSMSYTVIDTNLLFH